MVKDKITFDIQKGDYGLPDRKYILRCKHNGITMEAPRCYDVNDALTKADNYVNHLQDSGKKFNKKVTITINYE